MASGSPGFLHPSHSPGRNANGGRSKIYNFHSQARPDVGAFRWRSKTQWRTSRRAGFWVLRRVEPRPSDDDRGSHCEAGRGTVNRADHNIDLAVIEQIAKCCSTCQNDPSQPGSLNGRHVFESSTLPFWIRYVMKEQRSFSKRRAPLVLVYLRINMAVNHEEIKPSIVVVIEKTVPPTDEWNRGSCDTCLVAHVREAVVAVVAVEHLVVVTKVGNQKIDLAVVF